MPQVKSPVGIRPSRTSRPKIDLSVCSRLPTLPQVAVQILQTFDSIDTPLETVINIIERDPAVASKIMLTANSARYAPNPRIVDLRRAVLMLGKRSVTPLVLSFCLAPEAMQKGPVARYYQAYWLNALVRSVAGRVITQRLDPKLAGDSATVALLSNLGRLALLRHHTDLCVECLDLAEASGAPESEVELEHIGFSHIDLSVEIMLHLRMAERATRAIRMQMRPAQYLVNDVPAADRTLCLIVAASRSLADCILGRNVAISYVCLGEYLEALAHPCAHEPEKLVPVVKEELEEMRTLMEMDSPAIPDPVVLLQQALEQLAQFAMMAHTDVSETQVPTQLLAENGKLKRRVSELIQKATIDPLTGIYNRAQLDSMSKKLFSLALMRSESVGVLLFDVDYFKKVNDCHGHAAGDRVLKEVAQRLTESVRDCDIVGRYGGEEFLILVKNATPEILRAVTERARTAIEKMVLEEGTEKFSVTISAGGAIVVPTGQQDAAQRVFQAADAALYRAKRSGRNCAVIADSEC